MARPRRPFEKRLAGVQMDPDMRSILEAQADEAGLTLGGYLELILAKAYHYQGPTLPHVEWLPTAVPVDEVRAKVEEIDPEVLRRRIQPGVPLHARSVVSVRADVPLAERIAERCAELDCKYATFLRATFTVAAGLGERYDSRPDQELDDTQGRALAS